MVQPKKHNKRGGKTKKPKSGAKQHRQLGNLEKWRLLSVVLLNKLLLREKIFYEGILRRQCF
jgi:hypothetical protein